MGTWFWLNIPFMLLFFCLWAGIPLWYALTRWNAELNAKHAELATGAVPAPAFAPQAPAATAAHETGSPAYAGSGDPRGR